METVVQRHELLVTTKVSKEIEPFQQEFPT